MNFEELTRADNRTLENYLLQGKTLACRALWIGNLTDGIPIQERFCLETGNSEKALSIVEVQSGLYLGKAYHAFAGTLIAMSYFVLKPAVDQ